MSHGPHNSTPDELGEANEDEKVEILKPLFIKEAPPLKDMPSYKLIANIKIDAMEPFIDTTFYGVAHAEANYWEEQMFPKGFKAMAKLDDLLEDNELAGANDREGKLYVSAKVPAKYRQEVCYHEWVES